MTNNSLIRPITFSNATFAINVNAPEIRVSAIRRAAHGDWRTQSVKNYFMGMEENTCGEVIKIVENLEGSWCRVRLDVNGRTADICPLDLEVISSSSTVTGQQVAGTPLPSNCRHIRPDPTPKYLTVRLSDSPEAFAASGISQKAKLGLTMVNLEALGYTFVNCQVREHSLKPSPENHEVDFVFQYEHFKKTEVSPVAWQSRTWYEENTVTPGWQEWEIITEDKFKEINECIEHGYTVYETRELYVK